ncbi:MAG: hypothetical protein LBS82_03170, partial [Spirochaetaceae bacterium]|nr:hypothetical protein [Spirochaetaceae bacterium]
MDWMPGKRQGKLNMAITWVATLSEVNPNPSGEPGTNAAAWGVPDDQVVELGVHINKCSALLNKVKDPTTATRVLRKQCKAAFLILDKKMRGLHTYFYTNKFPELELYRLGLIPHGEGGAGHSKDRENIAFSLRTLPTNHEIFADFRRLGAQTHDKGVHHAAEARTWILPLDAPAP